MGHSLVPEHHTLDAGTKENHTAEVCTLSRKLGLRCTAAGLIPHRTSEASLSASVHGLSAPRVLWVHMCAPQVGVCARLWGQACMISA